MDVSDKELFASFPYENQKICPSCKCFLISNTNTVENSTSKYMFYALAIIVLLRYADILGKFIYCLFILGIVAYYIFWSEVKLKHWPRYIEGMSLPESKETLKKLEVSSQVMIIFLLLVTMVLSYWRWW